MRENELPPEPRSDIGAGYGERAGVPGSQLAPDVEEALGSPRSLL